MPSAASPAIDSDNKTVVPPTPSERATMTPVPKSSSGKAHFNASLDMALQLLQKQTVEDLSSSATPEPSLPRAQTKAFPAQYAATPDDLISADTPFSDTPTCCNSHASSVSLGEQSNVKSAELDVEKTQRVEAECQVRARIPYPGGHFYLHVFHTDEDDKEHLAMVFGDDIRSASLEHTRAGESDMDRKIRGASTGALRRLVGQDIAQRGLAPPSPPDMDMFTFEPDPAEQFAASRVSVVDAPLVRMHSECFTGETVSSVRCDCGYQLAEAMRLMQQEGRGVIVYLRQEGRGIGLLEKLKAYNLQDMGHDTVDANLLLNHPADARTYGAARAILADLGVANMRLLTNNADKIRQLCGPAGPRVVCRVPMHPRWWGEGDGVQLSYARHLLLRRNVMSEADRYLRTKAERMGHMLPSEQSLVPSIALPRAPTSSLFAQTKAL